MWTDNNKNHLAVDDGGEEGFNNNNTTTIGYCLTKEALPIINASLSSPVAYNKQQQ